MAQTRRGRLNLGTNRENLPHRGNSLQPNLMNKGLLLPPKPKPVVKGTAKEFLKQGDVNRKATGLTKSKPLKPEVVHDEEEPMDVDGANCRFQSLPPGVSNVDEFDASDSSLCSDNVRSIYIYLRHLERKQLIKENFLKGCSINAKMRAVLVDWLTEVHEQFKLLQETLYMTVAILDRYLSVEGLRVKRQKLQLIGVTSMFIASKYEEMYTPDIGDFVYITDHSCSAKDIRALEIEILKALNFDLGRPFSLHFLRRNSKAGDVSAEHHNLAKLALEVSFVEYSLAHVDPSRMAAAALMLSIRVFDESPNFESVWTPNLSFYSGYVVSDLKFIAQKMSTLLLGMETSKYKTIYIKYQSKSRLGMSSLVETRCRDLLVKIGEED